MIKVVLDGECSLETTIDGDCDLLTVIDGEAVQVIEVSRQNYYQGDYVVTPAENQQTLITSNMLMADNLIIEPIPQNYGLITWDGTTLKVS